MPADPVRLVASIHMGPASQPHARHTKPTGRRAAAETTFHKTAERPRARGPWEDSPRQSRSRGPSRQPPALGPLLPDPRLRRFSPSPFKEG